MQGSSASSSAWSDVPAEFIVVFNGSLGWSSRESFCTQPGILCRRHLHHLGMLIINSTVPDLLGALDQHTSGSVRFAQKPRRLHAIGSPVEIKEDLSPFANDGLPLWNLDRIDQRSDSLDNTYSYYADGTGTHFWLLDTGIMPNHIEFRTSLEATSTRIAEAVLITSDSNTPYDIYGHGEGIKPPLSGTNSCRSQGCPPPLPTAGSHVAGTATGLRVGVAKGATIHSLKVLNDQGSGYSSDLVTALEYVIANRSLGAGNVINLSIGSPGPSAE